MPSHGPVILSHSTIVIFTDLSAGVGSLRSAFPRIILELGV